MAMLAEAQRLEKERLHHETSLQQKQLAYLLDRCNAYSTQATLITGFAFTSFSADALQDLDYSKTPTRSFLFVCAGATCMALSFGTIIVSAFLTSQAERLAMEVDVRTAVALVRWRMVWIVWPYTLSLLFLFVSAALLVFATCKADGGDQEALCNVSGGIVILIFVCIGGFLTWYPRWTIMRDVQKAYASHDAHDAIRSGAHEPLRHGPSSSAMHQPAGHPGEELR